jgi:hypothetical protein
MAAALPAFQASLRPQGGDARTIALAMGVAVACALLAAAPAGLTVTARWLAITIAGWSATLALIDAPPAVAYQHLRPLEPDPLQWLAIAIVVAQAACLGLAGRNHLLAAGQWVRRHPHPLALAAVAVAAFVASAVPSADVMAWLIELAMASTLQLLALLTLVAAARSVEPRAQHDLERVVDRVLGAELPAGVVRIDTWIIGVAAGATTLAAFLAWFAWDAHPHVPDEIVYLIQARYHAERLLTMPLPPVPAGFNIDLMHYEATRWFSPVPPGWPMVLTLGVWLGAPWLVNPVLGGVAIVLAYLLLGMLYGRRTARLGAILLACSPWFLFLSMSFMTHPVTLAAALGAAVCVAMSRESGRWLPALVGGALTGVLSLVRPLEGLIAAVLLGLWMLGAPWRRIRLVPAVAFGIGTLAVGGLVRPYNEALTGSADVFPIMAYTDKYYAPGSNALGFGPDRGLGWPGLDPFPGHGAVDVVVNAALNTAQTSIELLGWPVSAVAIIALILLPPWGRLQRADWWMLAAIAAVIGVHSLYWFSGGPDFGARYWYLIILPCCALVARVLLLLDVEAGRASRGRVPGMALLLCASVLLVFVPWRAVGKYRDYRGMRADVPHLALEHAFGRSLVLVRGDRHPDYHSAAIYNPIDLQADAPVYAWDASPEVRKALLAAYPDRPVWIIDGPSLTHDAYRVVAGPLTAEQIRTSGIPPDPAGSRVYDPVTPPPRPTR